MKKRRYYHRIMLVVGAILLGFSLNIETIDAVSTTDETVSDTIDAGALSHVDASNFLDYFKLNGSAKYDTNSGIVTITPDVNNQVGNFSLKSKIDMSNSFELDGQVNLGDKTSNKGGADGIGFAFHNGNVTDVGNAGGNLGIGNLIDALGFKLDTWHNDYYIPQAGIPGSQVLPEDSNGYGWAADPVNPQFGAFVTTSLKQIKAWDGKEHDRWWAETDLNSVQDLEAQDLDGKFHDFKVSYEGSTRQLTINYTQASGKILTWEKVVPTTDEAMAMIVSASTGGAKNLQQFKLNSFDYQQAATVNVRYVNTEGRQIGQSTVAYPQGAIVGGTYETKQLDIPDYKFVHMDDGKITGTASLAASGNLEKAGDNGTIVYVYEPAFEITQKVVNEKIHYVDEDNQTLVKDYNSKPITFITVKNPISNEIKTYYTVGVHDNPTVTENGTPISQDGVQWTAGDETSFAAVNHPEIDGYKVISNSAPDGDLSKVSEQLINLDSSDLEFTVVYRKDDAPDSGNPGEPGDSGDTGNPGEPGDPGDTGEPGNPGDTGEPGNSGDTGDPGNSGDSGNPSNSGKPVLPGKPTNPSGSVNSGETANNNNVFVNQGLPDTTASKNGLKKLPQTGEKSSKWQVNVGLSILASVGLWGCWLWRKAY